MDGMYKHKGVIMKPTFLLIGNGTPFLFVVPPMDLRIDTGQEVNIVNIIDLGEKTIIGNRKVNRISFSTFIPGLNSPFFNILNPILPGEAIKVLEKWKDKKTKVNLIVPEFNMFYKCYVESLEISLIERTGDIHIYISLIEQGKTKSLIDEVSKLYVR